MQQEMQINNSIVERFSMLNKKERLAHAYLFIGPSNIGKGETALAIAKLINCEQSGVKAYCDICSACIKINSGNHPDVMIIDHEYGEAIKIEHIRALLNQSKLRPFLAERKVFIINNIENMTLPTDDLLDLVEKYQPITRYTIGENQQHIIFHLKNDKEISISVKKKDESFEGLGQLRNKNQRGFGEASSTLNADFELDVVKNILENLLEYNTKGQNK